MTDAVEDGICLPSGTAEFALPARAAGGQRRERCRLPPLPLDLLSFCRFRHLSSVGIISSTHTASCTLHRGGSRQAAASKPSSAGRWLARRLEAVRSLSTILESMLHAIPAPGPLEPPSQTLLAPSLLLAVAPAEGQQPGDAAGGDAQQPAADAAAGGGGGAAAAGGPQQPPLVAADGLDEGLEEDLDEVDDVDEEEEDDDGDLPDEEVQVRRGRCSTRSTWRALPLARGNAVRRSTQ